jgi:hypothetical protein
MASLATAHISAEAAIIFLITVSFVSIAGLPRTGRGGTAARRPANDGTIEWKEKRLKILHNDAKNAPHHVGAHSSGRVTVHALADGSAVMSAGSPISRL